MNRSQAERLRSRMSAEHPDRETHSFILSELDGVWTVAKLALPPASASGPGGRRAGAANPPHDHHGPRPPGGIPHWSAGS